MHSVAEALRLILEAAEPNPAARVALGDAVGSVLADDLASDVDSPPHDKSLVDGYAVLAADLAAGSARLQVLEEVTAGAVPARAVVRGTATRLMTGAPLPAGAEAVVKVEQSALEPAADGSLGWVELHAQGVAAGDNVMARGSSLRRGELVLRRGVRLRPLEIGLLAETGAATVPVVRRPSVAVVATGNELVSVDAVPTAGQIRNSNGPLLLAALGQEGVPAKDLGIAADDPNRLEATVQRGLEADVLLLSGGVSAGVLDLVPLVLERLGVERVFHKVRLKPGKPLWFGVHRGDGGRRLVFGLPGNPVSTLVCFELFVRPALRRLAGRSDWERPAVAALLTHDFAHRGERPTYHPARLRREGPAWHAEPLLWRGSADQRALVEADALAIFPAGDRHWRAGEAIDVLPL
jgi:molybdopterin molybdotransferase